MELYLIIAGIILGVYLVMGIITSIIFYKNMPESYHQDVTSWFSVRKTEVIIEILFFPILWFGLIYKFSSKESEDE